jgi:Na+/H+-dicarboxylate symporter
MIKGRLKMMKLSLGTKTLVGMILGAILGLIMGDQVNFIKFVGDIFLRMLRMAVVPLIFLNVTSAITGLGELKKLSKLGAKLIVLFMGTTIAAASIGLLAASITNPGLGVALEDASEVAAVEAPTVTGVITGMIPTNALQALAEGNMLQVIVFAIFSGVAILLLKEEDVKKINNGMKLILSYIMNVLKIVMKFSPIGVFALMAVTMGTYGTSILGPLAKFIGTIYFSIAIHIVIIYFGLYFILTRKNPLTMFRKLSPVLITAFTTCSTAATIPVSLRTCEEELELPKDVVGLTIPVGGTINMDGNGLWYGVVAIFASQIVGISLTPIQMFTGILMGVMMTLGSPGIPGGIFVATTVFLTSLGLPLEIIGMLAGIFRIMDMGLTTTNVLGSAVVASIVGENEKSKLAKAQI